MEVTSFLTDYAITFLENMDAILKKIKSINRNCQGFNFCVEYKENKKCFLIKPLLDESIFEKTKTDQFLGIIALSNPENMKFLLKQWKNISRHKGMVFYFINPFSNLDKIWIICPYVHNRICDNSSLELGLKSMMDLVESITIEELQNKIIDNR